MNGNVFRTCLNVYTLKVISGMLYEAGVAKWVRNFASDLIVFVLTCFEKLYRLSEVDTTLLSEVSVEKVVADPLFLHLLYEKVKWMSW